MLVGGASRRMGQDKAVMEIDGRPMVARVADALVAGGAEQVVLVGGDPTWAEALSLVHVPDRWPGEGPLAGLATALANSWPDGPRALGGDPGSIVVVTACDQPDLDARTIATLVAALADAPAEMQAVAIRTVTGRRHPFPSAWRSGAASTLVDVVDAGARRADAGFAAVGVVEILGEAATLVDLDTPEDIDRWRRSFPPRS